MVNVRVTSFFHSFIHSQLDLDKVSHFNISYEDKKAIRVLTQVALTGVQIVGRAFVDAYKVASEILPLNARSESLFTFPDKKVLRMRRLLGPNEPGPSPQTRLPMPQLVKQE